MESLQRENTIEYGAYVSYIDAAAAAVTVDHVGSSIRFRALVVSKMENMIHIRLGFKRTEFQSNVN